MKFAKYASRSVQFHFDYTHIGEKAPYLWYVNLNFKKPSKSWEARRLVAWVHQEGLSEREWGYERVFRYLKKHQQSFRDCLTWIADGFRVEFSEGGQFPSPDENTESGCSDRWENYAPVRFFREHALTHSCVGFSPDWQEHSSLSGLGLSPETRRDPLDPICWHLLAVLVNVGRPLVRRCRYWRCRKFFQPPTNRRLFCSDSCRAMEHVNVDFDDDEERREKLLKKNSQYMRNYRAIPSVKRRT